MNRCKAFMEALHAKGETAAVLHRGENMRYLTGYTGEGCVFVTDDAWVIVTDSRYTEQAGRQAPECACEMTKYGRGENDVLKELTARYGVKRLCAESDYLTYKAYTAKQAALEGVELIDLGGIPEELRTRKDAYEIECIKKACAISCDAFNNILGRMKVGMTEKEIALMLEYEMYSLGGEGLAFDTIAAAGVNGSLPHAIPSDYRVQSGDLLTLDFGTKIDGYCADMTRTVGFGKVSPQLREMYEDVRAAQQMGLDAAKPGACCGDVDKQVRDYLNGKYPGCFGHGLGHGVGLFIHENPRFSIGQTTVLTPGIAITVEPGVYIPGVGGCRIEDTIIITEDGHYDCVYAPKQLIEL